MIDCTLVKHGNDKQPGRQTDTQTHRQTEGQAN